MVPSVHVVWGMPTRELVALKWVSSLWIRGSPSQVWGTYSTSAAEALENGVDYEFMDVLGGTAADSRVGCRIKVARLFQMFVCLQFVDLLTTLLALRFGGQELNPVLRGFMQLGPITGLIVGKLTVLAVGAFVVWCQRPRVLVIANRFYCALAAWNLAVILGLKS
jgi:hypothetical protein